MVYTCNIYSHVIYCFTDCPVNRCGLDCSLDCYCAEDNIPHDLMLIGKCPTTCRPRWTGLDGYCNVGKYLCILDV